MATTVRREFEVRDAAKPLAEDLMDNVRSQDVCDS